MGSNIPMPVSLLDNKINRMSKAEVAAREANEVKGCESKLTPPKGLSPVAKAEWRRVVRLYRQLESDIINDLDLSLLAGYCESVAVYKEAQKAYQKEPLVTETPTGRLVESPYLRIMDTALKQIARAAEQLCLSPVGRARMGVLAAKKQVQEDPMEQWLQKKQKSG